MLGNLFDDDFEKGSEDTEGPRRPGIEPPPRPRAPCGLCGINNQGATCYLNSLIQTLLYTPEFRESLFCLGEDELGDLQDKDKPGSKVRVIPIQLQRLFARLLLSNRQSVSTEDLTHSFGWTNNEQFQQHDVQELNRILFSAIESSLVGTAGRDLISHLYHGKLVNQIKCMDCGNVSEREEDFLDLPVTVAGSVGLEQSLHSQYCEVEMMTDKNQYRCSKCNKLVDASKGAKIRSLPSILTVSLLRFSFNFKTMERYKETGKFVFPHDIDMRAYCDNPVEGGENMYELFSVVIHSGGAHGGHYFAFIRDVDSLGKWVAPEEQEILLAPDPSTGTVDFIEVESPLELVECLLLKEKNKGMSIDKLCQEIMKQTGVSWNKRFKRQWGPINKFLVKYDDKFIYDPQHNHVSLKVNGSKCEANPSNVDNSDGPAQGRETTPDTASGKGEQGDFKSSGKLKGEKVDGSAPVPGRCWFNFNDSQVSPIHAKEIEKKFSGKMSAYMLFYRKKSMRRPERGQGDCTYGIPERLLTDVTVENQKLDQQRQEYDVLVNRIGVQIHFSQHYEYTEGALKPRESQPCWRELSIDRRKTTADLFQAIQEFGKELLPSNSFHVNRLRELPAGGHLYEELPESSDLSLAQLDVTDGAKLFVWDGVMVAGKAVPEGEDHAPVFLTVLYGADQQFSRGLSKSLTLSKVKGIVCDKIGIRSQDLILKRLVGKENNLTTVIFTEKEWPRTVAELKLADGDQLVAEDRRKQRSGVTDETLKQRVMSNKFLVKVENRCVVGLQGDFDFPVMDIEVDRETTVEDLKVLTLTSFGMEIPAGGGRMRIEHDTLGLRQPLHEELSVFEAGISSGTTVILEEGQAPKTDEFTLFFTTVGSKVKPEREHEVIVTRHLHVSQCLDCMMEKAGITEGFWHLRKTNWCGEAADLLDDPDLTLDESLVNDGDYILLEEGRLPPKGFIRLPILLFSTPASVVMTSQGTGLLSWISSGFQSLMGNNSTTTEPVRSEEVTAKEKQVQLGEVEISRETTLEDLKYQVMTLEPVSELPIPSPGFMRLRLVENGRLTSVLRDKNQTLRRLKLSSNSVIGLQILPEEEDLNGNQLVLSIAERVPDTRTYKPTFDLVWDMAQGASVHSLKQVVSDALTIPLDRVCVAKHFPQRHDWLVIEVKLKPWQQKGKKKGGQAKTSLKQAPYSLRDGDLIGVKDLLFDPNNIDNFTTEDDDLGKIRLLQEAEDKRKLREEKKKMQSGFGDWPGTRRPEVGITISVGDFS